MNEAMRAGFFAVNVKEKHRQAFLDASIFEAQSVVSEEAGVFQFHVMVDEADPNRFYFFEVYRDKAAIQEHWETDVFKTWWSTVEPMLDGGLETVAKMRSIFPTQKGFEAQKPGLLQW